VGSHHISESNPIIITLHHFWGSRVRDKINEQRRSAEGIGEQLYSCARISGTNLQTWLRDKIWLWVGDRGVHGIWWWK